jgi:putative colanic acid biosynthesis UDP-glucose lipid carrier transferase
METRYQYVLRFALAISDMVLINSCFFLSYYILNNGAVGVGTVFYKQTVIVCSLLWLLSAGLFKLYSDAIVKELDAIYTGSWKTITVHAVLFPGYFLVMDYQRMPGSFLLLFYVFVISGLVISRYTGTVLQRTLDQNYDIRKVVAVLSVRDGGAKLAAYLKKQSSINFAGFLEKPSGVNYESTAHGSTRQQLRKAAESGIEEVFVSVRPDNIDEMATLIREGEEECVRLRFVPNLTEGAELKLDLSENFPILSNRKEPLEHIANRVQKRVFDVLVSLTAIVFIFSWLFPILALIIKIQSRGPILFKQLRTGRDNKPFACYKFRSMYINAQSDNLQATRHDSRVTPIGRFMRRTSLDEFPQFFNVLFGTMSVIGPRPHMIAHTEEYRQIVNRYMVRQFLKPGISGWAQVNGYRGETRENEQMVKRVEHDLWYMENWSVMLDIRIMYMTIMNTFRKEENAY